MWVAVQFEGSRIRIEDWVVQLYFRRHLTDPLLLAPILSSVLLYKER